MTRPRLGAAVAITVLLLAGCSPLGPSESGYSDPYESTNRAWFDNNLALAQAITPGDAEDEAEAPAQPGPVRRMVSNFGANLGLPSVILNDLLQIRPDRAAENTVRLVINTTVGLGGLFDPATRAGVYGRRTDFGETMYRWGAAEGPYMVLPVIGPTTQRDAFGRIVDIAINPLRYALAPDEAAYATAARLAGRVAEAGEYSELLDANVINTADPYAQARLLYLQTRRYHLGSDAEEDFIDPYADF
ncbi:VacJ family lipoprotein [Rhodobacter sp. NTK016B]|uniref:MlaA family lipoprotein n=1 Tax=Rhodobacter sp. NTK016B TaxID=2759676 RepID=UPI001A9028EE|nr:VacJ family lipoprotein [Rhodobacter sp. NTK016B]MBN8294617.1 VacJ family lipoprotein [Rhodobacter sp. NTK016B]